jgi:hypothetical protein
MNVSDASNRLPDARHGNGRSKTGAGYVADGNDETAVEQSESIEPITADQRLRAPGLVNRVKIVAEL